MSFGDRDLVWVILAILVGVGSSGCGNTDSVASNPDASIESEPDGVSNAQDTPDSRSTRPNQCADSAQVRDYLVSESPSAHIIESPPWRLISGAAPDSGSFVATWQGTTELSEAVTLECLPLVQKAGLRCETETVLEVSRQTGSGTVENQFAVSVPLDELSLPDPGTKVEFATHFGGGTNNGNGGDEGGPLTIRTERSGELIVSLEFIAGKMDGTFEHELEQMTVKMPSTDGNPSSAYCIARSLCPMNVRFEPLVVAGASTKHIDPGSQAQVTTSETGYRFWHIASKGYSYADLPGWPDFECLPAVQPVASFALGRR